MLFMALFLYFSCFIYPAAQRAIISEYSDTISRPKNVKVYAVDDGVANQVNYNEMDYIINKVKMLLQKNIRKDHTDSSTDVNRRFWNFFQPSKVVMVPKSDKNFELTPSLAMSDDSVVDPVTKSTIKTPRKPANKPQKPFIPKINETIIKTEVKINMDNFERTNKKLTDVLKNLTQVLEKLNLNIQVENNLKTISHHKILREPSAEENGPTSESTKSEKDNDKTTTTTMPDGADDANNTRRNDGSGNDNDNDRFLDDPLLTYYVYNTFRDIKQQLAPLQHIRDTFTPYELYKIGYLVSNLDNLEENIVNLKHALENDDIKWKDRQMFDVFDRLLMTNNVVSDLMKVVEEFERKYRDDMISSSRGN